MRDLEPGAGRARRLDRLGDRFEDVVGLVADMSGVEEAVAGGRSHQVHYFRVRSEKPGRIDEPGREAENPLSGGAFEDRRCIHPTTGRPTSSDTATSGSAP
ncbi:hypothetical protein [Actinoplanes sp. NPDC023714]|uniref:hypothetical protein n=1 Tax=Actinoplanes sp. NPDC023714 TaxID=3154322 RepID=UPI0033D748BA